jgi:hypothetical protein
MGRIMKGRLEMWHMRVRETPVEVCEHEQVNVTSFAGLQRTVCGDCGHVSVGYLHDSFEELSKQLHSIDD